MFLTKSIRATALLSALAIFGAVLGRAADNDRTSPPDPNPPTFQGKVTAIAVDGKSITLERSRRGEDTEKNDVKMDGKTKIEAGGILKGLIAKLKVGDTVSVWLREGSKDTAGIVQAQRSPDLTGKITAASGKTFTLESAGQPVHVKITDKTKMGVRGEAKLTVGHSASVWLQDGSKDVAVAVQSSSPDQPRERR